MLRPAACHLTNVSRIGVGPAVASAEELLSYLVHLGNRVGTFVDVLEQARPKVEPSIPGDMVFIPGGTFRIGSDRHYREAPTGLPSTAFGWTACR
jgi:hypothetical protein